MGIRLNLYHYCSQRTFLSILENKSFWCSALSLSNDTMEGRWLHKVFSDVADRDELASYDKNRLLNNVGFLNDSFEGLGFCLSEHSDSLSQWRGYAQDGEGFCLGFSKEALHKLAKSLTDIEQVGFILEKIIYDDSVQRKEVEPIYRIIKRYIDEGAYRSSTLITQAATEEKRKRDDDRRRLAQRRIADQVLGAFPKMFTLKNPAFVEESEWRVVSIFLKKQQVNIDFRSAGDRIVPYRSFEFQPETGIITEVVLGPKNQSPVDIVEIALKRYGYEGVKVRKSAATYR